MSRKIYVLNWFLISYTTFLYKNKYEYTQFIKLNLSLIKLKFLDCTYTYY